MTTKNEEQRAQAEAMEALALFGDAVRDTVIDAAHTVNAGAMDQFQLTVTVAKASDGDVSLTVELDPPLENLLVPVQSSEKARDV